MEEEKKKKKKKAYVSFEIRELEAAAVEGYYLRGFGRGGGGVGRRGGVDGRAGIALEGWLI